MNKHYVFWPFRAQTYENMAREQYGARRALREFQRPSGSMAYIRYGSRKHRGRLESCNSADKSLYVTGHGAPGHAFISNTPDGAGEQLHALVVVSRLIEYGLRKTSACKLKLFSCYSGVDGPESVGFARAMHMILRHLDYDDIEVYGYTQAVSPYGGNQHTTFFGQGPGGIVGLWNRASTVRIHIQ
jgi:hypothetical protein